MKGRFIARDGNLAHRDLCETFYEGDEPHRFHVEMEAVRGGAWMWMVTLNDRRCALGVSSGRTKARAIAIDTCRLLVAGRTPYGITAFGNRVAAAVRAAQPNTGGESKAPDDSAGLSPPGVPPPRRVNRKR